MATPVATSGPRVDRRSVRVTTSFTFGLGLSTARVRPRSARCGVTVTALVLLAVQLLLGLASYLERAASPYEPQPLTPMIAVTVAHVSCGALVFAATIVLTLRVFRVLRAERREYVLAPA